MPGDNAETPLQRHSLAPVPGGGWVPIPDPTHLTTEQLRRELGALQAVLDARIGALEYRLGVAEDTAEKSVANLKTLLDERYTAQTKRFEDTRDAAVRAVEAALGSAKQAVDKAEAATEKRFENVNEFRQTLSEQAGTFLPREEYSVAHKAQADRVSLLRDDLTRLTGLAAPRSETDALRTQLTAQINRNAEVINALELRLTNQLAAAAGQNTGATETREEHRITQGLNLQTLAIVVIGIGVIVSIVALLLHK